MQHRPFVCPRAFLPLLLFFAGCATQPELEYGRDIAIDLHFGELELDDSDWGSLDNQRSGSFAVDWGSNATGLRWEVAYSGSTDDLNNVETATNLMTMMPEDVTVDVDGRTEELSAGARYVFGKQSRFRPYVGLGLSWLEASIERDEPDGFELADDGESESDLGLYAQLGGYYYIGDGLRAGLAYRAVFGPEFELSGVDLDGDYQRVTIFIGFSF
ncbi:MAG: porin family protein [bacterium]|nr:porin family protein [bacterium]